MKNDRQIDGALRETLGQAAVPELSHDFRDRLKAAIEAQPKPRRWRLPRPGPGLLLTLAVVYLILGTASTPFLAARLGGQAMPPVASLVLITAAVFSAAATLSVTLLYLTQRRT